MVRISSFVENSKIKKIKKLSVNYQFCELVGQIPTNINEKIGYEQMDLIKTDDFYKSLLNHFGRKISEYKTKGVLEPCNHAKTMTLFNNYEQALNVKILNYEESYMKNGNIYFKSSVLFTA